MLIFDIILLFMNIALVMDNYKRGKIGWVLFQGILIGTLITTITSQILFDNYYTLVIISH